MAKTNKHKLLAELTRMGACAKARRYVNRTPHERLMRRLPRDYAQWMVANLPRLALEAGIDESFVCSCSECDKTGVSRRAYAAFVRRLTFKNGHFALD